MEREVHEPDEVNRGEVILVLSLLFLLLDREGRIEYSAFIEVPLWGNLQFNDETRPVRIRTLDIDPYIFLPREGIGVFGVGVSEVHDGVFRDEFLKEKLQETLAAFRSERPFEPVVHNNAGVPPHNEFGHKQTKLSNPTRKWPVQKASPQVLLHRDRPGQRWAMTSVRND